MSDADRLREERARLVGIVQDLSRDFDGIVAATADSATDDEHDPEGSTIAFERQRVAALLRDASLKLRALDEALVTIGSGQYGTCASCGGPIGEERLAALPVTRRCFACARASYGRTIRTVR